MSETNRPAEVQDFIDCARATGGFLILETWDCEKCGAECHTFHKFTEVMTCGNCGQRVPSRIPLYRFAMEQAANGR